MLRIFLNRVATSYSYYKYVCAVTELFPMTLSNSLCLLRKHVLNKKVSVIPDKTGTCIQDIVCTVLQA